MFSALSISKLHGKYMHGNKILTLVARMGSKDVELLDLVIHDRYTACGHAFAVNINIAARLQRIPENAVGRVWIIKPQRQMKRAFRVKLIDMIKPLRYLVIAPHALGS